MEGVRSYILQVVIAAIITGVITTLSQNSRFRPVLRLICGLFLSWMVLQPLSGGIPEIRLNWTEQATQAAAELAQEGSLAANSAMEDIITEELEAYILDKAADLNTALEVNLQLDGDLLPASVDIRGTVTASVKRELEKLLEEELGIPKENQAWTG